MHRTFGGALAAAAAFAPAMLWAQVSDRYVSPWKTPWTYEGERGSDRWAALDPEYAACAGKSQSPIDIQETQKRALPDLKFEYKSSTINYVINNGHTIRVNYDASGSGDFLVVGDKRYELTQFHFHHPSEERVHGKAYDMVVHLMHKADDGEIAGVAVPIKIGASNAAIHKLWANMPKEEGQVETGGLELNPADLLPSDTNHYYTYLGSQTAPPCAEGVRWFILKTPIEISSKDLKAFAKIYPDDARAPQPLNGRTVMESQ